MSDQYLEAAARTMRDREQADADRTYPTFEKYRERWMADAKAAVEAWVGDRESFPWCFTHGQKPLQCNRDDSLMYREHDVGDAVVVRVSVTEGEQHPFNDVLSPPSGICADCGERENQHE